MFCYGRYDRTSLNKARDAAQQKKKLSLKSSKFKISTRIKRTNLLSSGGMVAHHVNYSARRIQRLMRRQRYRAVRRMDS